MGDGRRDWAGTGTDELLNGQSEQLASKIP